MLNADMYWKCGCEIDVTRPYLHAAIGDQRFLGFFDIGIFP